MCTFYKKYVSPAKWGISPSTLQTCCTQISEHTYGFKGWKQGGCVTCSITTSKWHILDVNSWMTWKPLWTPSFKIFFLSHSQLFNNVYVCSHCPPKAADSQNCRSWTPQNVPHDFNGFAIFSKQSTKQNAWVHGTSCRWKGYYNKS